MVPELQIVRTAIDAQSSCRGQKKGIRRPGCPHSYATTGQIQGATCRKSQKRLPESRAAAGSVKTQAMAMFLMVDHCKPLLLAAMVPATPELRTCVVETGRPKLSAAKMVAMATSSALAPWA